MSEYEIFNNGEDNINIVPEPKKTKKKKTTTKEKAVKEMNCCIKEFFALPYLPVYLSGLAIFFALFVKFLPIASATVASISAAAAFFFIGFGCAFAALVIEVINMFKEKNFNFNLKVILICLSFFVLFI